MPISDQPGDDDLCAFRTARDLPVIVIGKLHTQLVHKTIIENVSPCSNRRVTLCPLYDSVAWGLNVCSFKQVVIFLCPGEPPVD